MSGRDMIVEGVVVPFSTLENAFAHMVGETFTFAQLQNGLASLGVDTGTAYRAADRLLQQKRRAGRITFANKVWKKVSPA